MQLPDALSQTCVTNFVLKSLLDIDPLDMADENLIEQLNRFLLFRLQPIRRHILLPMLVSFISLD